MEFDALLEQVKALTPPIAFRGIPRFFDISGLLAKPTLFHASIEQLAKLVSQFEPDYICALDARGFLLASPVCLKLNVPLIMIRKRGKLPGECLFTTFDKEYESGDVFEMQSGSILPGARVVIIDDVLATGGSLRGAISLVKHFQPAAVTGVCLIDVGLPGVDEDLKSRGISVVSLFDASSW